MPPKREDRRQRHGAASAAFLQRPQPAVEIAYLDGVGKSVDHLCQFGCFGGCECAPRNRRGDRLHRGREIGRLAHRRERERHQPLTMRRDQAVETEPQRGRVATESELDGLAGQGLSLALEQPLGGLRRVIATPARAAGGIAGTPLLERAGAPAVFAVFAGNYQQSLAYLRRNPGLPAPWQTKEQRARASLPVNHKLLNLAGVRACAACRRNYLFVRVDTSLRYQHIQYNLSKNK